VGFTMHRPRGFVIVDLPDLVADVRSRLGLTATDPTDGMTGSRAYAPVRCARLNDCFAASSANITPIVTDEENAGTTRDEQR
jgi:hypothetical protein